MLVIVNNRPFHRQRPSVFTCLIVSKAVCVWTNKIIRQYENVGDTFWADIAQCCVFRYKGQPAGFRQHPTRLETESEGHPHPPPSLFLLPALVADSKILSWFIIHTGCIHYVKTSELFAVWSSQGILVFSRCYCLCLECHGHVHLDPGTVLEARPCLK